MFNIGPKSEEKKSDIALIWRLKLILALFMKWNTIFTIQHDCY